MARRPSIIVPDAAPLIHLAAADALSLLEAFGPVVLVDMVVLETTGDLRKPWAPEIATWLRGAAAVGSNRTVSVESTDIGEAVRRARMVDPTFSVRGGGEVAIIQWLADRIEDAGQSAIVIYENGRVPNVVARQGLDADILIVTTRALLDMAEQRGLIPSGEALWQTIIARVSTANPQRLTTAIRPTR